MALSSLKRWLLGAPLSNAHIEDEKLPKWKALPVFASDALSSVAYATEEILIALVALSLSAASWSLPIALTIAALLIIVSISYRQTISLYPSGGGAYIVAKENLGVVPGLVAGGALLLDYVLTVSVSISAGVAAITSAFPSLRGHEVMLASLAVTLITVVNLRGTKESGLIFSLPTYAFIMALVALIGYGFGGSALGFVSNEGTVDIFHETYPAVPLFLLLRAFSSGCAALTGIEAISNGVMAFKQPRAQNAKATMTWMVLLLGIFFIGVTALSHMHGIVPSANETVLSQVARKIFGQGVLYYVVQITTALILFLAANTAYNDFPRLTSVLAFDRFLPRQLMNLGDRLVFSNGIISLGAAAFLLIALFGANTHALVPLYSVGVFLSFTLSQSGMVVHHLKHREQHWMKGLVINAVGAVTTFVVLCVVGITKFTHGAWAVLLLIPVLIAIFRKIKAHYEETARQLAPPPDWQLATEIQPSLVVIPVSGFHRGVLQAIQYARSLSKDVRLCTVNMDPIATRLLMHTWTKHSENLAHPPEFKVLDSPYRSVTQPIVTYLEELERDHPGRMLTVVIPEFITRKWWHNLLHNQNALFLSTRLRFWRDITVISVRCHLD